MPIDGQLNEYKRAIYGWVHFVGKRLLAPLDDLDYPFDEDDFDWTVCVIDEAGQPHEFKMSAQETHPMPFIGKWVEVRIHGMELNGAERASLLYPSANNMIERE